MRDANGYCLAAKCVRGIAFLIGSFAILHALACLSDSAAVAQSAMPNIVYILADDMGIGDVRSYTSNSPVNTPNIDRIANAGMRFTDAHSLDAVCTPSRYGILTGQYAWRTSLQSGVLNPYAPPLINADRLTVSEMLKTSGYDTGAFGKWHLGMTWATTNSQAPTTSGSNVDHSQAITNGPTDRGFDTFFGVDAVNYPPYAFIRNNKTVGPDLVTPTSPTGQVYGNPSNTVINSLGPIAPGYDIHNTLPTIIGQANAFIGSKANQAKPFFAYIPLTAPHEPIVPPSFAQGQTGLNGNNASAYGDFIWSVDWAVGQVLDKLSDPDGNPNTNDSVLDNTLVVFTADNGADTGASFSSSPGKINGVPLRGSKAQIYEGGTREPFLAQWTGHVPAGTVNNHLVMLNDLMATVSGITGYNLPSSSAEDSINILSELTGSATTSVRTAGVTHSTQGAMAIRQIDSAGNEWKLIFTPGDGGYLDTQKVDPKATITDFSKLQLYNLTSDPGEQSNLLSGGGSQGTQQKALQLQGLLQGYIYSGRSTAVPPRTSITGASTMLVDFGNNLSQTNLPGWNNLAGNTFGDPSFAKGLYDQGGGYMGIVLKSQFVNAGSSTGVTDPAANYNGPYPAGLAGVPDTALQDGFYVADNGKLVITLESLDAHATYDLLFYSATKFGMDYTLFTVIGATTQQGHIAPVVNNATQVAEFLGITADSLRRIEIDVEGRQPNGSLQNPSVNFDGRGQLNFMRIIEHLLEIPGDFNGDRIVDSADYYAWRSALGTTGTNAADGNHDGVVDGSDYLIWRKAISSIATGSGSGSAQLPSGVPEPTGIILFAVAMMGLALNSPRGSRFSGSRRRA
jgi:arylsulfatase A